MANLEDRQKFAKLSVSKKISENKGIIKVKKEEIGAVIKEVFATFAPENVTISEIDTEEVIGKIFQKK